MRYKCPLPPETVAVDACCYVYDTENERYYLQSRYYDPKICRFINADSYTSTGQGLLGNNMFAYCGNNPVGRADFAGHAFVQMAYDDGNHLSLLFSALGGGGGGCSYALAGFSAAKDGIRKLKDFLTNESEVAVMQNLKEYGISFYKGTLVVKTPFDASFSFGVIGLSAQDQDINTLKHEYGHTVQMKNMGLGSFLGDVVVPSVTINILDRLGKLPYDYFSYPWGAEANRLGGATLSQGWKPPLPEGGYTSYWDLIRLFFE